MLIRPATLADAPALAAVEIASWRAAYQGLMPAAFLAQLSVAEKTRAWQHNLAKHGPAGRKRVLVACAATEVIGFERVGVMEEASREGLLYLLYVLPQHWGHGVGQTLLAAALSEFRHWGVTLAQLWVLRDNVRARQFYARQGWQENGQTSTADYGGVALEALGYQRPLDD